MESVQVHIAVLSITDGSPSTEVAVENIVADRATEAGHQITAFTAVRDSETAIRAQLVGWIADPDVDVVIVVGEGEATSRALAPLVEQALPGFADLLRLLAYEEIGASAMLSAAEAARCDGTFVFVLPSSENAVRAAMEKLILPQLDPQTQPRNLIGSMPRLRTDVTSVDVANPDAANADVTKVDVAKAADNVPTEIPAERTAAGHGPIPKLPAPPAPRTRSHTGPNVIVRKVEDPTKRIELAKLEHQIAMSKPGTPATPTELERTGDVTKPMDLGRMPRVPRAQLAPPVARIAVVRQPASAARSRPAAEVSAAPASRPSEPALPVSARSEAPPSSARPVSARSEPAPSSARSLEPEALSAPVVARSAPPATPAASHAATRAAKPATPRPADPAASRSAQPETPSPRLPPPPPPRTTPPEAPEPPRNPIELATQVEETIEPQIEPPAARPRPARAPVLPPPPLLVEEVSTPAASSSSSELPRGSFVYPVIRQRSRVPIVIGVLAVAGIAAGAVWYFGLREDSTPPSKPNPEVAQVAAKPVEPDAPPVEPDAPPAMDAAVAEIEIDPVDAQVAAPEPPVARPKPAQRPQPKPRVTPKPGSNAPPLRPDEVVAGKPPVPVESDCDETQCVLEKYARPCCVRFKPTGDSFKPTVGPADGLAPPQIRAGVEKVKPRVIACGEQFKAKGTVKLALTVDGEGNVSELAVQTTPDDALGSCVASALRKAHFAKTVNGGSFTYPFVF